MVRQPLAIRILVLSRAVDTIDAVCAAAERVSIRCEISPDAAACVKKLAREKFEGVLLDFENLEDPKAFVELLHNSSSHRQAITFGVVAEGVEAKNASRSGVHFVLRRPLDEVELRRTMRAALPLLIRERRRYFRCPLVTPVLIDSDDSGRVIAKSINVSEGGMAIEADATIAVGKKLLARFQLPGSASRISVSAEVCWAKGTLMGLRFVDVSTNVLATLQSWLSEQVEQTVPTERVT